MQKLVKTKNLKKVKPSSNIYKGILQFLLLVLSLNKTLSDGSMKCFYSTPCSYILNPHFLLPFKFK